MQLPGQHLTEGNSPETSGAGLSQLPLSCLRLASTTLTYQASLQRCGKSTKAGFQVDPAVSATAATFLCPILRLLAKLRRTEVWHALCCSTCQEQPGFCDHFLWTVLPLAEMLTGTWQYVYDPGKKEHESAQDKCKRIDNTGGSLQNVKAASANRQAVYEYRGWQPHCTAAVQGVQSR